MQKSKITVEQWRNTFEGYVVRGCAVRERGIYYFMLEELPRARDVGERPGYTGENKLAIYFASDPEPWSYSALTGFSSPRLAVAHRPKPQAVVVGGLGNVYYIGSGEDGVEPRYYPVTRLRSIAGWVFATHLSRGVSVRRDAGAWESFEDGMETPAESEGYGFMDISGVSEDEIYVVGGRGDVWHWNGAAWTRCSFPSNIHLRTVLYAGDGQVYITGQGGAVYAGKGDRWKKLDGGNLALYFNDTVWYDEKLWLANDSGLYYLDASGRLRSAELPASIHVTTGHLSVGDGLMLSAGTGGVSVYDGNRWEILVNHVDMQLAARSTTGAG